MIRAQEKKADKVVQAPGDHWVPMAPIWVLVLACVLSHCVHLDHASCVMRSYIGHIWKASSENIQAHAPLLVITILQSKACRGGILVCCCSINSLTSWNPEHRNELLHKVWFCFGDLSKKKSRWKWLIYIFRAEVNQCNSYILKYSSGQWNINIKHDDNDD